MGGYMARKSRVTFQLDAGDIQELSQDDIVMILRGADMMIASGGRNLLAKLLKGSKDKKILELHLNECPAYGYYHDKTLKEITHCIDYCIKKDYLSIRYNGRLPMLVFAPKGWEIEKHTYALEWYDVLEVMSNNDSIDMEQIKQLLNVNREVVLLILDMIKNKHNTKLIPLLLCWKEIEVKKVRKEINNVISSLQDN